MPKASATAHTSRPADTGRGPALDGPTPGDDLVDALAQNAFRVVSVLSRVAAEHDLSLTQLRVLGILRDRRLRISELADYLGLERSTLTGLVDRAEQRGLVERGVDPSDRRAVEVGLAGQGLALADEVAGQIRRVLAPTFAHLTTSERRRLQALLERMLSPGG